MLSVSTVMVVTWKILSSWDASQTKIKLNYRQLYPLLRLNPSVGLLAVKGCLFAITPSGSPTPANGDPSAMEGASAASTMRTSMDDVETEADASVENPIQSKCEKVELEGIGIVIKNLIQDIEKAKETGEELGELYHQPPSTI